MKKTRNFDASMLPVLGVRWERFPTQAQAEAFASWAERVTARDHYPCEATIDWRPDYSVGEQWEVRVRSGRYPHW